MKKHDKKTLAVRVINTVRPQSMMANKRKVKKHNTKPLSGIDFFSEFWEESWTYIKTVVDVLREPVIILDKNFIVLAANEAFYSLFKTSPEKTEGFLVYELGNGQWNIPALRKLLEDILKKDSFFKGFEVEHTFPIIGHRTIILNARHIYSLDKTTSELFPPIIMIAMEDISEIIAIASHLATYTKKLEKSITTQTEILESKVGTLEKKVSHLETGTQDTQ